MKAFISIRFNKNMINEIPPTIGGFHVIDTYGKTYGFDFNKIQYGCRKSDPHVVDYMLRDEDVETFPKIPELQAKWLKLRDWESFYLDYSEKTDPTIKVIV